MHLIVRACQNRKIKTRRKSRGFLSGLSTVCRKQAGSHVKSLLSPGRKERVAELAVRFSPVELCKPKKGAARDLPETLALTMVDVREVADAGKQ